MTPWRMSHKLCACVLSCVRLFATPWPLCPWDFPGMNIGVDYQALLQGIFPSQGLNLHLVFPALAGGFFTTSATREAQAMKVVKQK